MTYLSHDEYFATVPMDVQPRLAQIQAKVESLIPGASRCIGYNMPAFRDKRIFFYFAAFKKHIGIYPRFPGMRRSSGSWSLFEARRATSRFAHHQPLPIELIGRVAVALHREYALK
jgi:uncharacterized protein YdhG (YjbR/CyaY superfamily)